MKMLSLQRALRTLTGDYKCLKRQVQDFPLMLDKAITEAKQEVPSTFRQKWLTVSLLGNGSSSEFDRSACDAVLPSCWRTESVSQICQVIGEVSNMNQELLRKYKREMNLRKKCHNELVRLKGLNPNR